MFSASLEILEALDPETADYRIVVAIFDGARKRSEIMDEANLSAPEYEAAKKRLRVFLTKFWQKRCSAQHKEVEVQP